MNHRSGGERAIGCRMCCFCAEARPPFDTPRTKSGCIVELGSAARVVLTSSFRMRGKKEEGGRRTKGNREHWKTCDTCVTQPCTSISKWSRPVTQHLPASCTRGCTEGSTAEHG